MAVTAEAIKKITSEPEREAKLKPELIKGFKRRKKTQPEEQPSSKFKSKFKKELTYEDFYNLCGVKQHSEFEAFLKEVVFDKERRENFYDGLLSINPYLKERD